MDENKAMFFGEAVTIAYIIKYLLDIHSRILIDDFVVKTVLNSIENMKMEIAANDSEWMCGIIT